MEDEWDVHLDELKEYFDNHRTYKIPYKYKPPSGFHLHGWVHRQVKIKSKLSTEQIKKLDELILSGQITNSLMNGKKNFKDFREFVESNRFARPGDDYVDKTAQNLGHLLGVNASLYKNG